MSLISRFELVFFSFFLFFTSQIFTYSHATDANKEISALLSPVEIEHLGAVFDLAESSDKITMLKSLESYFNTKIFPYGRKTLGERKEDIHLIPITTIAAHCNPTVINEERIKAVSGFLAKIFKKTVLAAETEKDLRIAATDFLRKIISGLSLWEWKSGIQVASELHEGSYYMIAISDDVITLMKESVKKIKKAVLNEEVLRVSNEILFHIPVRGTREEAMRAASQQLFLMVVSRCELFLEIAPEPKP